MCRKEPLLAVGIESIAYVSGGDGTSVYCWWALGLLSIGSIACVSGGGGHMSIVAPTLTHTSLHV